MVSPSYNPPTPHSAPVMKSRRRGGRRCNSLGAILIIEMLLVALSCLLLVTVSSLLELMLLCSEAALCVAERQHLLSEPILSEEELAVLGAHGWRRGSSLRGMSRGARIMSRLLVGLTNVRVELVLCVMVRRRIGTWGVMPLALVPSSSRGLSPCAVNFMRPMRRHDRGRGQV